MSTIFMEREKSAWRPHCVADEPVDREPVSGAEFPVNREKNREIEKIDAA
jgi:hypothetical protein